MMTRRLTRAALGLAVCVAGAGAALAQDAKQILELTKPKWIAVREYDGKDLLYFSNILGWRCGVEDIRFAINGEKLRPLEYEPCHEDEANPNALYAEDIEPYLSFPLGSVNKIEVEVSFPDGSTSVGQYDRKAVAIR